MKNIILSVFAIAVLISCSSDSEGDQVDSQLKINNVTFTPDQDADGFHYTRTNKIQNGNMTTQMFVLEKGQAVNGNWQIFSVQISYSTSQGANGTYNFEALNSGEAMGFFQIPNALGFTIDQGSVTVKDMGHNYYKLTFNNVTATHYLGELPNRSVTGYFQGRFTVPPPSEEILID